MTNVVLCALDDIDDPGSRAFSVGEGDWPLRGFLVKRAGQIRGYVNSCPHAGHPLNWRPDEFLTLDRTLIQCASHGALFEMDTGHCVAGPCAGRSLRTLKVHVENGFIVLDGAAVPDGGS